jgi:hypothetical protein
MDGVSPDLGKIVAPGYINANPPGNPEFALSPDGSGFAISIQQAGGEVSVDPLGGINLVASSGAFVGVDSFANITLNTSTTTGVILIKTNGGGNNVDIENAGTIEFDAVGAGAITGVQTINGAVYPPPGGGGTSITQGGALVACLGNGAINISSIGAGVVADIYNAGTITFDTAGPAALVNLSTINGVAYTPFTGSFSTITNTGGDVEVTADTISIQTSGNAFMTLQGTGAVDPGKVEITSGSGNAAVVLGPSNTILLDNPGATLPSYITMTDDGNVEINGAAVAITNLSTINGVAFPFSSIGDIATGGFVITTTTDVGLGVSSSAITIDSGNAVIIGDGTANVDMVYVSTITASATGLDIFETTAGAKVKLDTGGRVKFNEGLTTVTDGAGLVVGLEGSTLTFPLDPTSAFNVGEIINVSTINGVAYPPVVAVIQATYSKSVAQTMTSGANDVTFDQTAAYNNDAGYITHTNGTTVFTVVQDGVYQLEFNASIVANGATWGTGSNKSINIDITRSPTAETAIISSGCLTSSASNYSQCVSATYALEAGDVINLRVFNIFATAVPDIQGSSGFDLNTFFTWRFIS